MLHPHRWAPTAAALFALVTLGSAAAASGDDRPGLELRWTDARGVLDDGLISRGYDAMASEVTRIFAAAGLRVRWSPLDASAAAPARDATRVIVVLTTARPESWDLPPSTLGAVMGRNGPLRCVYVFHPSVAREMGLAARPRTSGDFHRLGRSVGRVAAHEIVHALAPQLQHRSTGLMRARLSRADLLSPGLGLDDADSRRLLAIASTARRTRE